MIIQTGMRTDIPAFYSKWLINRIREGFVMVRNPYYPNQVTRYSLSSDVVDIMAFCTKNPAPMLPFLNELNSTYWFVTITPYGSDIEPNVPDKENVIKDFKELSQIVGVNSVGWRYDPIFIDDMHTVKWHIQQFGSMAEKLAGYTKTCVISFIDIYKKLEKNFPAAREVAREERIMLGRELIRIAGSFGMTIRPCAEGDELAEYGADCTGCMTVKTFEAALGMQLCVPRKTTNQRNKQCACLLGVDIGAYNTCGHLCRYCYANSNAALVRENMKLHDPKSPFLIGGSRQDDIVREATQKSWIDGQMSFDFT